MQYAIPAAPMRVTYGNPVYSALDALKEELASPVKRRDRVEIMICAAILLLSLPPSFDSFVVNFQHEQARGHP